MKQTYEERLKEAELRKYDSDYKLIQPYFERDSNYNLWYTNLKLEVSKKRIEY